MRWNYITVNKFVEIADYHQLIKRISFLSNSKRKKNQLDDKPKISLYSQNRSLYNRTKRTHQELAFTVLILRRRHEYISPEMLGKRTPERALGGA